MIIFHIWEKCLRTTLAQHFRQPESVSHFRLTFVVHTHAQLISSTLLVCFVFFCFFFYYYYLSLWNMDDVMDEQKHLHRTKRRLCQEKKNRNERATSNTQNMCARWKSNILVLLSSHRPTLSAHAGCTLLIALCIRNDASNRLAIHIRYNGTRRHTHTHKTWSPEKKNGMEYYST